MSALLQLIKTILKRFNFILIVTLLVTSTVALSIYIINPYEIDSTSVRPLIFGYDMYRIPSKSMQPLLVPGDYILVSHIAYSSKMPERNDVIVFYGNSTASLKRKTPYIKRIVGIQGDRIKINSGVVILNNQPINDPYVKTENKSRDYSRKMSELLVPQGKVFVLGDNRDNSNDSRVYGAISTSAIIGKATSILYGANGRSGNKIK
jgi:signal peptidase I